MINKPRYEIENEDLESIGRELDELVNTGNYPKYGTQSDKKTYVITRDSLKGLVLRYIREIKEKAENKGKCVWKNIARKDLEKMANGDSCITLGLEKPCYTCDGTKKYARKINCRTYQEQ